VRIGNVSLVMGTTLTFTIAKRSEWDGPCAKTV
jgi:hypothetical protein